VVVWKSGVANRELNAPSSRPLTNAPLSEARQFAAKARALIESIDNTTREELALSDQLCERAQAWRVAYPPEKVEAKP
jgi:hypothetical protein